MHCWQLHCWQQWLEDRYALLAARLEYIAHLGALFSTGGVPFAPPGSNPARNWVQATYLS